MSLKAAGWGASGCSVAGHLGAALGHGGHRATTKTGEHGHHILKRRHLVTCTGANGSAPWTLDPLEPLGATWARVRCLDDPRPIPQPKCRHASPPVRMANTAREYVS
eukprot:6961804-Pyramimonas_sp.AAC.1